VAPRTSSRIASSNRRQRLPASARFVTAGSGSTTITISGANFRTGATAQWNGANRSATLVSGTSMTMTLTAADRRDGADGTDHRDQPGASGISNVMAIGVVSSGPSLAVDKTVTLTHADLVYDPSRKRVVRLGAERAGQYATRSSGSTPRAAP
jgi:hypothetical protein